MFKIFTSTLLILSIPLNVFAVMQSANYRIDYEAITPGGQTESSTNYKMLETLGEIGDGMPKGIQADQPPAPTLLNTGSYNSLNFRINRGYELSDTDPSLVAHYKFNTDPLVDSYTTTGVASETISGTLKIAQKFQAGSATRISAIDIYQTTAGNLVGGIRIETDSDGSPSGNLVYTDAYQNNITLNASSATHIPLNAISVITAGMEYWIVFSTDSGSGTFQGGTAGIADQAKYYDGSSWNYSATVESLYFKIQNQTDDSSDTGNNGKAVGPVTTSDGRFGRGIQFDGANDYVDSGNIGTGIKTVEFWIKAGTTTQSILELSATVNISVSGGTVSATGFNSPTIYVNGVQKNSGLTTDWTHMAVVDGGAGVTADAVKPGRISANYLNGILDEVGIYNRAKTALEIARDSQIDNPEDAEYAIAISDDNWTTTKYIQTNNTLGSSIAWQSYANWGSGNGETLIGLKQETEYKMKVKARQADFTETGWSSETSATTSSLDLTFSFDKTWLDLGTLVPNQVSSGSHLLTIITNGEAGYVTTIQKDGNLRLGDGLGDIDDVSDGSVSRGEEYGVRTSGSAEGWMNSQDTPITSNAQTIALSAVPVNPSVVTVTYKAVVDTLTLAGKYSQIVTYITTATF